MHSRTMLTTSVVVLVACLTLATPPGHGAEGPPAGGSLTGYWKLDRDRSDDPDEKAREAMEGLRTGDYDPGSAGAPTGPGIDVIVPGDPRTRTPTGVGSGYPRNPGRSPYGSDPRRAVFPEIDQPRELMIAQRTTLVLIQEGDDEGSVRGVHTDGTRRPMPANRSEIRGHWEKGQLVVETWRSNGLQTVETFELSPDPRELTVTVTVMAPGLNPLTVTSIYEPDRSKR